MSISISSLKARSLSPSKVALLIKLAFSDAFESEEYMARVTASLFNYIDIKNNGKVTFAAFLRKFYPNFSDAHLKEMNKWVDHS